MKIESKEIEGISIITPIVQRIDVTTCEEFKNEIATLIQQGKRTILLNLSKVNFIDSCGLGALISIFKSLTDKGWLGLCEATPNVADLFKLTRMDRLFDIYSSEKDAVQQKKSKKDPFDK